MSKFRVELWRIAKFLLFSIVIDLLLGLISILIINEIMSSLNGSTGLRLTIHNYAHLFLGTTILTLVHRQFTFRATEKWYIALPIMLVFMLAWQWLSHFPLAIATRNSQETLTVMSNFLGIAGMLLQYLLQRYVIYCHTTDQNGWYRRFHTNTEEGVHPYE